MPIERISSDEAFSRLRKNVNSKWPDGRKGTQRMVDTVWVSSEPSFAINSSDMVMTMGSCFAREIEKHLVERGFDLPMKSIAIPQEERVSKVANDLLNKYTIQSMENEIRWAFEGVPVPDEDLFLQTKDNLWHDPHLSPNLIPASLKRVAERRDMVCSAFKRLPECKLVIATLGLAECWYDSKTDIHLNGVPPNDAIKREPERFFLDVLNYEEILESLERLHSLIRKYGHPEVRFLVTVSPVPFKATFTGGDAIAANCYSKSVQRAACEAFVKSHDYVDYFPSYETVTLTGREAMMPDNIHPRPEVVHAIMSRVLTAYSLESEQVERVELPKLAGVSAKSGYEVLRDKVNTSYRERKYERAVMICEFILRNFITSHVPKLVLTSKQLADIYSIYGVALLRCKKTAEGVAILRKAIGYNPLNARLHYKVGLGLARLKCRDEALQWFETALSLDATVPDYNWRYAAELLRVGKVEASRVFVLKALALESSHEHALKLLDELNSYS
jgi:hypothetical protein